MLMKRWIAYLLVLACVFSGCAAVTLADETENLTVTQGCHSYDGNRALLGTDRLTDNAGAVFLYETGSQTVMYQWNGDKQFYPASLVKIMTALLVLEKGTMTDTVTVGQSALNTVSYEDISVDLQAGEQISVENLMYCMLVYSANDAAAVLAEYVAGSQQAFVDMMNSRAAELGCTGTVFTNAHGLHDEKQVTTARDLTRILDKALAFSPFRTYFGTINYQVPATNLHKERNLSSHNFLMNRESVGIYYDDRVAGGRTGITSKGYRNIASVSRDGNMEIICIVLDSASTLSETGRTEKYGGFAETIALLDQVYNGYAKRQIVYPNQTLKQISVIGGDNDLFVTSTEGFSTVLPGDISIDQLKFSYEELSGGIKAPVTKGQRIGSLQVWYDSMCIAQTDVFAMNDVAVAFEKSGELRSEEQGMPWWGIALIVLGAIVLCGGVFLILMRIRAKKIAASKMRRQPVGRR